MTDLEERTLREESRKAHAEIARLKREGRYDEDYDEAHKRAFRADNRLEELKRRKGDGE